MIIQEKLSIDGKDFIYTYSTLGYKIKREGEVYYDAIDPLEKERVYTETEEKTGQDVHQKMLSLLEDLED